MFAFLVGTATGRRVAAGILAAVALGGVVLWLEHRGAARQAASDRAVSAQAVVAQATEIAAEQSQAAATSAAHEAESVDAVQAVQSADRHVEEIVVKAKRSFGDDPDNSEPVPASIQRVLDELRSSSSAAATGRS